jgi:hypothetical protein
MNTIMRRSLMLVLCSLVFVGLVFGKSTTQERTMAKPSAVGVTQSAVNINNLVYWLTKEAAGTTSGSPNGTQADYPKGTGGLIYEDGMLWGVKASDANTTQRVRVGGSTYNKGMKAGHVIYDGSGNLAGASDPADAHVWRVRTDYMTADLTEDAGIFFNTSSPTAAEVQEVRDSYAYDWENWPADLGAPYEDVNGNGSYDPADDIPGYPGADQTMWAIANDIPEIVDEFGVATGDTSNTAPNLYGADPVGVELAVTLWAYNFGASDPLGNIVFKSAKMKYVGLPGGPSDARLDTVYFTQWSDPDLGTYTDDYVGADTTLSFGFVYNGNAVDGVFNGIYGLPVPAGGYDFLQGPITTAGDTLGMTSFTYFGAGSSISDPDLSNYDGTLQFFNLMEGFLPRPEYPVQDPWTDLSTGEETKFVLSGDPVTGQGWIDGVQLPPGDRRMVMASGPFTMELGDEQEIVLAVVGGIGSDNISSVTVAKFHDTYAQYAYDQDFTLPSAPTSPKVQTVELDGEVTINWGFDDAAVASTEEIVSVGFEFEGYNVYQIPSATAPLTSGKKIATFDLVNVTQTIFDKGVDPSSGFVVDQVKQSGSNTGIQRYYNTDYDELRNRPMSNGVTYYFAVTAYSFYPANTIQDPFRTLESSPAIVAVTPHDANPGTMINEQGDDVTATHAGTSTGYVTVEVIDPTRLDSGDYTVSYMYYNPTTDEQKSALTAADTLADGSSWPTGWNLAKNGTAVPDFQNQVPYSTEATVTADAPIIEGAFQLVVADPPVTDYSSWDYDGNRWISGVDWGARGLFGGLDIGANFFGSTLDNSELVNVQMVFQDAAGVAADGYLSEGPVYRRDLGYAYDGIGQLPFAVYDMTDPASPRRLNVAFVEHDGQDGAAANKIWDMGADANGEFPGDLGAREYIFMMASDYNGGVDYNDDNFAPSADVYYAIWPKDRGTRTYLLEEFTLDIFASKSAVPGSDSWTFSFEGFETGVAVADIDNVSVYPNPYYGFHQLEANRANKYVSFNHLPEQATIKVYTLGGTLVREVNKDDATQFATWDLNNQYGYPVASGIYIIHVNSDFGEKILKLALVRETQVLKYY